MKKMFLSSYFTGVANLLPEFYGDSLKNAKVVFIPTASVVEKVTFFIESDKKALIKLGCIIDELEISTAKMEDIVDKLTSADIIFVDGGNTFFLLQEMKRSGADELIIEHISKGKLYIGASAGSIIACPDIGYIKYLDNPDKAPMLDGDFSSLSVVDFSIVPHYTNFPFKKAAEKIISIYSDSLDIKAINNKQVVTVQGDDVRILTA